MHPEVEKRSQDAELTLEVRTDGGQEKRVLTGYAAVFNSPSNPLKVGGRSFIEKIQPGAFRSSLAARHDVIARVEHDAYQLPLGRTSAGTLRLSEDSHGLRFELDVPDTQAGRDVATLVQRGDIRGASFAFRNAKDAWAEDNGVKMRTLLSADLVDVSPVATPAYEATNLAFRSLDLAAAEQASNEAQFRRRKLRLIELG